MTATRNERALEVKSAGSADVTGAFEDIMTSFEAFRDANDQRLQAVTAVAGCSRYWAGWPPTAASADECIRIRMRGEGRACGSKMFIPHSAVMR